MPVTDISMLVITACVARRIVIACSKHRVEILNKQSCLFEILGSSCGAVGQCRRQRVLRLFNFLKRQIPHLVQALIAQA